eukprot:230278-Chlamydomonas_euryale.AAC.8
MVVETATAHRTQRPRITLYATRNSRGGSPGAGGAAQPGRRARCCGAATGHLHRLQFCSQGPRGQLTCRTMVALRLALGGRRFAGYKRLCDGGNGGCEGGVLVHGLPKYATRKGSAASTLVVSALSLIQSPTFTQYERQHHLSWQSKAQALKKPPKLCTKPSF